MTTCKSPSDQSFNNEDKLKLNLSEVAPKDMEVIRMAVDLLAHDQGSSLGISTLIRNTIINSDGDLIDKDEVDNFIYHLYFKTFHPDTYAVMGK
jgi:hypothetical protein